MKQLIIRYKWSILLWLLSTIIVPIVIIRITTPKPKLGFYLGESYFIANTRNKVDSLFVTFRNHDISKDSMNMLWTTIDIFNSSRADIKESDYASEPFGLKVKDCKIIAVRAVDTLSNHLARIIKPRIIDSTDIEFNKIAFDSREKVKISIYLLYKWGHMPTQASYIPIGKITGIKTLAALPLSEENSSTWDNIIDFLEFIGYELAILLPLAFLLVYSQRWYRKKKISKRLNPNTTRPFKEIEKTIISVYVKLGKKDFITLIKGFVNDEEYPIKEWEVMNAYNKINETREKKFLFLFNRKLTYLSPFALSYPILSKVGLIKEQVGKLILTEELRIEAQRILYSFSQK